MVPCLMMMSQESLHSLGDSEVKLGVRPKDKHLGAVHKVHQAIFGQF